MLTYYFENFCRATIETAKEMLVAPLLTKQISSRNLFLFA